jgi:hypothetical protein
MGDFGAGVKPIIWPCSKDPRITSKTSQTHIKRRLKNLPKRVTKIHKKEKIGGTQ